MTSRWWVMPGSRSRVATALRCRMRIGTARRSRSRVATAFFTPLLATLALGLLPGVAVAHEIAGSRFDAPLPLTLLFAGAGATVALTALWLAVTDGGSNSQDPAHLLTIPVSAGDAAATVLRIAFLAVVAAAIAAGFVGPQVAAENAATLFAWPVWFRGLALLAVVVGSPWSVLSPWRTIYRGLVLLEGRPIAVLGAYPRRLGSWPAVAGFLLLLGVVENLTVVPRSPRLTAGILAAYALWMVGGAILFGDTWLRRADPLGVLYRLFGRVSPLDVSRAEDGYAVSLRWPWRGCLDSVRSGSLVVFVVATVYTVSFDGFTSTSHFRALQYGARDALGTGPGTSVLLYAVGLLGFVAAFAAVAWTVERLGQRHNDHWPSAARAFAPTVLPISAAYEVAHNYPYVLRNLDQLAVVASRPLVQVGPFEPLSWLSLPVFWGSQVALIVVGHVVAVVAAHRVAVTRYGAGRAALRGHLPLVALMVGYTVLSLWIVSQPVVAG